MAAEARSHWPHINRSLSGLFAVFYFSLLVLRPLSPRSGALMCSNQYKLLSSYPGKERYAVANSWLGFCAAKNRSAVQGVARRQGSAQEKECAAGRVRAKAGASQGRVTVQVASGHNQVADKSRPGRGTGHRQVADRSRTGHSQRWVKNHLLRSYAESTLGAGIFGPDRR